MPTSHNWRGNMALIIISFLSGYTSWQKGESLSSNACNYRGAGGTSISSRLLRLCCPSTLSATRCPPQRMTLCVRSPPLTPAPLPVMLSSHGKMTLWRTRRPDLLTVLIRELTREGPMISLPSGTRIWLVANVRICVNPSAGWANRYHVLDEDPFSRPSVYLPGTPWRTVKILG